jgi:hypothetical protein
MSLKGFFLGHGETNWDSKYLPALSALYDCLIDDDDEVREVAASAAAGVLGSYLVPPVAADRLVAWMREHYANQAEFQQHLAYRVTGQTPRLDTTSTFGLVSAEEQLLKAMEFDDALFATEEQNLFIDEVRETERWHKAVFDAEGVDREGGTFAALAKWTESGLRCLIRLAEKADGPLGWTSDQHAFAACARIVLCAVAISRKGEVSAVRELLDGFVSLGRKGRVHGSLLEMATGEV